ncbi:VOC family protein [Sulfuriflexus mobilis]|uniref:VOC family protein n=1 Tax=Sulfuriflexus mobilis TaxID=1811807 RepID=UPI000F82FA43|nr:VOC family protein [Sulfuriflexus mobilis]
MTEISISIDVSDMEKAVLFYTKALGCTELRAGEDTTKLKAENVRIYLLKKESGSNPLINGTSSRNYERHWTPVHLDFNVVEIEKIASLVKEYGGIIEGSESGDWGAVEFCADPFGNGFCLCQIKN